MCIRDSHLVAAGQCADKVVGTGGLGGGDDFLIGGIQAAIADVFIMVLLLYMSGCYFRSRSFFLWYSKTEGLSLIHI